MLKKVMVSACLLGDRVRHDAGDVKMDHRFFADLQKKGKLVKFCPETAAGLPTPRPAAEIQGGSGRDVLRGKAKVVDKDGRDLTAEYMDGARKALEFAEREGVSVAILKDRSPSCASRKLYDGTFSGKIDAGFGVTAALLGANGIAVFPENELGAAEVFWKMDVDND